MAADIKKIAFRGIVPAAGARGRRKRIPVGPRFPCHLAVVCAAATGACVVDGIDPDRTPVLKDGTACGANQLIVRTEAGWACADAPTASNQFSVEVDDPISCGVAGGHRITLRGSDAPPSTFEVCNGLPGPAGETGESAVAPEILPWRARAVITPATNSIPIVTSFIDRQTPEPVQNTGLQITTAPGSAGNANLRIACANGASATSDCGGRDEQVGVTFEAPTAGPYRLCVQFNHEVATTFNAPPARVFFLLAATDTNDDNIVARGIIEGGHGAGLNGGPDLGPIRICDAFEVNEVGPFTARLYVWQSGAIDTNLIVGSVVFDIERLAESE